ncbi:beta-barrel assembly-enhancing protease [Algicola sagamiensis]|uniref:beta-barrel assembly-enhancing protease n=1 Tax=Algicola sagamiensis TaxID=163869 RepID=UPI00037AC304|nr:M48 family metalloprotease [Algicola sagamiensis]
MKFFVSLVIASACFTSAQAANRLPDLGGTALSTITIEKELIMGDIFARKARAALPIVYDPLLSSYIETIGNKMVAQADGVQFPFQFVWVRDNAINAFATFGGNITAHTGLVLNAQSESELASVIGHEIAHITQRHLARKIEKMNQRAPMTIAGLFSSLLLGIVNPSLGIAALQTTAGLTQQASITYTRGNEQEADRIGMQIMTNAGFDPHDASSFYTRMSDKYRAATKPPAFLLTHPLPDNRVSDIRLRAQQYKKHTRKPEYDFWLTKARIIARFSNSSEGHAKDTFRDWQKSTYPDIKFAGQYGLALLDVDHQRYQSAASHLKELFKLQPHNLFLIDTYTDLLTATKQYKTALAFLAKEYQLRPNEQVVTLNYANVAIHADQPERAIRMLKSFLLQKGENYLGYDLLTNAYRKAKHPAYANIYQAQSDAYLGRYQKAIQSLRQAKEQLDEDNFTEKKRIEALEKKFAYQQRQMRQT